MIFEFWADSIVIFVYKIKLLCYFVFLSVLGILGQTALWDQSVPPSAIRV